MGNKLFGTDGIRGVANLAPMTAETAFRLARVLSQLLCTDKKRAVIAKDTRLSGDMLESALIAGFTSSGIDVVRLGIVPTPLLTAETSSLDADVAVMITASHNPYTDNGLKVINAEGDKLSDTQTSLIERRLSDPAPFDISPERIGRVTPDHSAVERYIDRALTLAQSAYPLTGLRVVLDCANGAFSDILPTVFKRFGADVITLSDKPDGFNINFNCGSQHTETMQKTVIEKQADLGIAVDGDGDRIIVCDEKGNRLDGDQIIAFLATYLQKNGKLKGQAAVATVWSNLGLEKYLNRIGLRLHRTPVGERYVIEKMRQTGVNIGGEESGHMVLSDYAKTGDAMLSGLVIALGLKQINRPMSEIFPMFEKCPCLITSVRFCSKDAAKSAFDHPDFQQILNESAQKIAQNGSIIVRPSGTEPVLKIRVESEDRTLAEDLSQKLTRKAEQIQKGNAND